MIASMQRYELRTLLQQMQSAGKPWHEFLRVPALSMGIYQLRAGDADKQSPHTEDEVYYILEGAAQFRCGDEVMAVSPGTILYVERLVPHRFFDITADLTILVFFAPAEGSNKFS